MTNPGAAPGIPAIGVFEAPAWAVPLIAPNGTRLSSRSLEGDHVLATQFMLAA
jgi:hypothetical protein